MPLPTDPVTTAVLSGGRPVGHTLYAALPHQTWPPGLEDHEPQAIRDHLVDALGPDARVPVGSWRYHTMRALNPNRDEGRAGDIAEYRRLIDATHAWYRREGVWFDHDALDTSAAELFELLDGR